MSVKILQQLLDSDAFPECVTPVNLIKEAHSNRMVSSHQRKTGLFPKYTLVLDGECALNRLYGGYYSDWVCGGQWHRMMQFVKALVEQLSTANIEFVVFFNGSIENERMNEWIEKQKEEHKKITKVLKIIENKGVPPPKALWIPPVGLHMALRFLLRFSNVKIVSTMDDHHKELINYLREHKCDGMIADDPEYIAFDPPRLFSAQHFKLTYKGALESKEYNLNKLREELGLTKEKMCILIALLGNHIISRKELDEVYGAVGAEIFDENSSVNVIKKLAEYINELDVSTTEPELAAAQLFKIADDPNVKKLTKSIQYYLEPFNESFQPCSAASVSGSSSFPMEMPVNSKKFKEDTEDILIHNSEVKRTIYERHSKGLMSPLVYQIVAKKEIKLPLLLEDFQEIPDIHAYYKPIRQKVYAILHNLHHRIFTAKKETPNAPVPDVVIKEWTWSKTENTYVAERVQAEHPGWGVPTLQKLWFGTGDEEKNRRIRAFLTCMRADGQLLLNTDYVPQHIVVGVIVLRYLMSFPDNPVLSKPELDAFIVTFLKPELQNVEYTQNVEIPTITCRGVQLATLFMAGVEMLILANDACGSPVPWVTCAPWLFFDGRLFQHVYYSTMKVKNLQQLCEGDSGLIMAVEQVKEAVLEGMGNGVFARPALLGPITSKPTYPRPSRAPVADYPPAGMRPEQGERPMGRGRRISGYNRSGAEGRANLEIAGVVVGSWETSRYSFGRGSASYLHSPQSRISGALGSFGGSGFGYPTKGSRYGISDGGKGRKGQQQQGKQRKGPRGNQKSAGRGGMTVGEPSDAGDDSLNGVSSATSGPENGDSLTDSCPHQFEDPVEDFDGGEGVTGI